MKYILLVLVISVSFLANAQEFQGKAEYFSKRIVKRKPANDAKKEKDPEFEKQFEEALKRATEKKYLLTFSKSEALFEEDQTLEKPKPASDGTTISISFSGAGRKYVNIKENKVILEEEIYGKEFLITDTLQSYSWKLIDETKKIGEYTCYKAEVVIPVSEREKQVYKTYLEKTSKSQKAPLFPMPEPTDKLKTAWYTPDIPVSLGPDNYFGLPGLILELSDEKTIILCSKVTLNTKSNFKIKPPGEGKKVSQKEFDAIQKKKTEQLMDEDGVINFSSTTEE